MVGGYIVCERSSQNLYYISSRPMDMTEAKTLCDAVNAAQFISERESSELIDKLLSGFSKYQEEILRAGIQKPVSNKITDYNSFKTDTINTAINRGMQITFQYYDFYSKKRKKLKHNGLVYKVSPYATVWNNDRYYLIGFSEKHKDIATFRIDRITNVNIIDEAVINKPDGFDLQTFLSHKFSMLSGHEQEVTLLCKNEHMKAVIDKFCDDVIPVISDDNCFKVTVSLEVSPTFFAWVFQYGGDIKIIGPESVINDFQTILNNF